MKRLLPLIIGSLIAVLFLSGAQAASWRSSETDNLLIPASDAGKDLYLGAGNVTIEAPTAGDLAVFAGSIIVNGNVENSLFIAAGTVAVRGDVGHHVRIAGGTISLSGKIGGDLLVVGGSVTLLETASVGGDLLVAGGTVIVEGPVTGQLRINSGSLQLNAETGPVTVSAEEVQLLGKAKINGDFTYTSANVANVAEAAIITGETSHLKPDSKVFRDFTGILTLHFLLKFIGTILLAGLLLRLFRSPSLKLVGEASSTVIESAAIGLAVIILVPIILLILLFTIVGWPFVGVGFAAWLLLVLLGSLVGKVVLGSVLVKALTKETSYRLDWPVVVVGVLIASLLGLIPLIGGFLTFLILIWGVGALTRLLRANHKAAG